MQFSEYAADGVIDYEEILQFYPREYAQRDVYICSGEGEEVYMPSFTFHCGRYCLVTGLEEWQATPELLEYVEVHADLARHGGFESSDKIANKLQAAALNSDLSNLIWFPLDCPHREKNGWTGDAAMSCEQFTLNLGMESFLRQWKRIENEKVALYINKGCDVYGKIYLPKEYVFAPETDIKDVPVGFESLEVKNTAKLEGKAVVILENGIYIAEKLKK